MKAAAEAAGASCGMGGFHNKGNFFIQILFGLLTYWPLGDLNVILKM